MKNIKPLRRMDVRDIIGDEARRAEISVADLLSKSRKRNISWPRQRAMWRCRTELGLSLTQIGEIFGRNHATVIHAIRKVEGGEEYLLQRKEKSYAGLIKTGLPLDMRCEVPGCDWRWTIDQHHESATEVHYLCPNHHSLLHRGKLKFKDVMLFADKYDLILQPA